MASHRRKLAAATRLRHEGSGEASLRRRGLLVVVLAALLVLAVATSALGATAPYTGVALYAGGNATLTDSSKVESPVIAGQPSAATYVNGILTTNRSASLSDTTLLVASRGDSVPPLGQFMPDSLVTSLTLASQAAQPIGDTYKGLNYSKGKGALFTAPITVNGDLTISGSGTYSFASVYVTGNVTISDSPTFSFASLHVGGRLTVSGGTPVHWGPTYVAGDVSLSKSGSRPISLLVTAGNFGISGTQTVGGDGLGANAQPAQVLLVGQNKQATMTDTSIFYGLLYNGSGGLTQSRTSTIRGSVLLAGDYSAAGTCTVQYDGDLLEKLMNSALSFTISFDSNGGGEVEPMQVNSGQVLGDLPVPSKDDSIFLGWYADDDSFVQVVTKDSPVISDLTLYARYTEIVGVQGPDLDDSVSAMDRETDFAIQVESSDSGMSADAVKAGLRLEVVDGTPFAGLSVIGTGGAYTVTAAEGYTPGSSYKLTLTDPALTFAGEAKSVRTYSFTITKQPVANMQLAPSVIEIPADDISDMMVNGAEALNLSVPLATTEGGLSDPGAGGTFTYTGTEPLTVGDVLAIYEGTPPAERNATVDYSDQPVAYVEVTAFADGTVTYKTPEVKEVLFIPDVLPVQLADDTDGDPNNSSITIAVSKMTYTDPVSADLGLGPDTIVEEGDFLALLTGSTEANANVTFGKITSVALSGDNYIIIYEVVTEDELTAAMDLYASHNADFGEELEQIDVAAMEAAIEKQAIDSGFAQAAAEYLTDLAETTDGFEGELDKSALLTAYSKASGSRISNLQVKAQIDTTLEHFPGLKGIDCAVTVSFDVAINDDLNLHLSGTFEEEVRVTLNTSGGAVWKRWGIFKIPYIADYRMTGNVDLYNYTGIDIKATMTTSAGDSSPIDIAAQIKTMMTAKSYKPEEISAGTQKFYDLYAEMLATEHGYVTIFKQQIVKFETGVDPFHILVAGLTLEFVVNADVNLSIGAQFDYTKGTRYAFTLLLFTKQSTSSQLDLVDETYNFNFYVMGTLGLRAGVVARVELGLFTLSLCSIGLELETGPYVRLWGYFFYELHYANKIRTSKTSGALYLELGIYFETRFLAQVLAGTYSYNPTLYEHEWPLWSVGSRYNVYDFSYTLTDATDDIRLKGATKTYALPASTFSMKQLDLTEGDVTTESKASSYFTISFTNTSFSQSNGTITVTPPAGQLIAEGYMTVTWKGAPLSFTTVPITRTYHLVWDDLASSYMISFNTQGGGSLSPIVGAYGSAVTLPTPTRAGYTFGGWYTTAAVTGNPYTATTMPATNPTLYAKWTPVTTPYTVRHHQQTVAGTSYALFATQSLSGVAGTSVTPARNSYAGFTAPAGQTVTINGDGSTVVSYYYTRNSYQLTFTPGTPDADIVRTVVFEGQIAPPTVARAGYIFAGWYDNATFSGSPYSGTLMPAANLRLYAKWTANTNTPYAVRHYQENLAAGTYTLASTQPLTGTSGSQVTPALNSYGGFTAPATQTVSIKGDGSTVVNYYYARNSYQVTFHPNDEGSATAGEFKYGALIVLPSVTKAGYTFGGWYDNGEFSGTPYTAASIMPAGDLDLYAKWTANTGTEYTVKHYQEPVTGTSWDLVETETLTGTTGSQVTPAVKTYEGFMVPALQTVTINADGSSVVEYRYYRAIYQVVFRLNNNNPSVFDWFRYGAPITAPSSVTRAGYTFVAWYDNSELSGDPYIIGTMPAANLELYAKWTANTDTPYTVRHYQLTVDGDPVLADTENLTGTTDTQVTPPVKAYVGFTAPATQTVTISGDGSAVIEYYYSRKSYEVTFHPNNDQSNTTGTFAYGASIVTPSVTKEGYTLAGWYDNAGFSGTAYTPTSTMPARNLDLYAKWAFATVVLYQVDARSDLTETDYIDWAQFGDPYGRNPMSFSNPPAQGVKTHNGHAVQVTSERGLRFTTNSQGWSWGGPYGAFAYRDALLQNEGGGDKPFTDNLASPIYDPLTIDFGTHPILAGGLQLEPLWHGIYTARIEAFDTTGGSLGSFTVEGDSRSDYVRHSNMEDYMLWGYGNSGSGSNTAAFLGVRSDVPIKKLVFTLLSTGPTTGGTRYQLGAFAINRVSIVSAPAPAISHELSSGVQATVSAPAWVRDTVTMTWDEARGVPTGSIRVTGTMPDGHTWEVGMVPIPADATAPFTFTTTDQGLGTGASWEGGVLAEGVYQFRAEYLPAADSRFRGAVSGLEQVTVDAPEYGPGAPLVTSPVYGSLEGTGPASDFRDWYDISLTEGDRLTVRVTNWTGLVAADMRIRVLHNGAEVDAETTWPSKTKADDWVYSVPFGGGGVYSLLVETVGGGGNYGFEYSKTAGTPVGWYDGFDSYEPGADMDGAGGWEQPGLIEGSPLLTVSDSYQRSGANSLELTPQSSTVPRIVVHPSPEITSGTWNVTAWWYAPTTGVQAQFWMYGMPLTDLLNGDDATLYAPDGSSVAVITEEWVPIRFVIDLDLNRYRMYYNNTLIWQGPYTADSIAFAVAARGGGSTTYLDDVSVMPTTWID
jgi:uncharacterized repeat protein (TIGR02543 family)